MSKQDPSKMASAPPPQFAYGAPLQQQYGSQPPPYSAQPPTQAYTNPAAQPAYTALQSSHAHAAYSHHAQAQSPYITQQFVPMPQVPQMQHGYVPPPASAYPRQQYMPVIQPQPVAPQGPPPPYTPVAQQMIVPQPQTVIVGGAYDAGARFDGISQPRIPPPPPGVAPNAAQMAHMQGHTVVGTQQRSNWFTGGSGGGSTLF